MRRCTLIILDSVGVGAMPDAADWGDAGSDTLGHAAHAVGGLVMPHLQAMGLGNIHAVEGLAPVDHPRGAWGRMSTLSSGKDTVTGHWELAGCLVREPFGYFPQGFPREILDPIEVASGHPVLGNLAASGTAIIEDLGPEHLRTGALIVYTSADSVLQIAAHEEVVPLTELYRICQVAFEALRPFKVARVIARPFLGRPGSFVRTENRRDFALLPPAETVMDRLVAAGCPVTGVGKVKQIFGERGFTESVKAGNNTAITDATLAVLDRQDRGFIFSNLVDFDMRYGHRRDAVGYARALEEFDRRVPEILRRLGPDDLLLITADHGNDPIHPGTDHTREEVPLLAWAPGIRPVDLGLRAQLADVGATVAVHLGVVPILTGVSFHHQVLA